VFSVLAAPLAAGCSSSGNGNGIGSTSQSSSSIVLDPTQPHYGHTDDEWGTLWQKWIDELPQPDPQNCIIPFMDPTGANCGYQQSGDVFFLAGTGGGSVVRDQCQVPKGKALFFPILSFGADNAGVDPSKWLSDADLQAYVQNELDGVSVSSLSVEFDGVAIPNLANYRTKITKFSYTLPPEPNDYSCQGQSGVTGYIDTSYAAGFFVMLAPPASGAHTLHFAGSSPASSPPLTVDTTYHFTIP
jgi:hypothetical protein